MSSYCLCIHCFEVASRNKPHSTGRLRTNFPPILVMLFDKPKLLPCADRKSSTVVIHVVVQWSIHLILRLERTREERLHIRILPFICYGRSPSWPFCPQTSAGSGKLWVYWWGDISLAWRVFEVLGEGQFHWDYSKYCLFIHFYLFPFLFLFFFSIYFLIWFIFLLSFFLYLSLVLLSSFTLPSFRSTFLRTSCWWYIRKKENGSESSSPGPFFTFSPPGNLSLGLQG